MRRFVIFENVFELIPNYLLTFKVNLNVANIVPFSKTGVIILQIMFKHPDLNVRNEKTILFCLIYNTHILYGSLKKAD